MYLYVMPFVFHTMPAVNLQISHNLFYTSELRRGNTLEPFENLATLYILSG